jgi:hypothetical protein
LECRWPYKVGRYRNLRVAIRLDIHDAEKQRERERETGDVVISLRVVVMW